MYQVPECPIGGSSGHFFYGSKCLFCDTPLPCCKNCTHAWSHFDDEKQREVYHCGSGVDDSDLQNPDTNPQWALIKFSMKGMCQAIIGEPLRNSDCEDLDPEFGRQCRLFDLRDDRS